MIGLLHHEEQYGSCNKPAYEPAETADPVNSETTSKILEPKSRTSSSLANESADGIDQRTWGNFPGTSYALIQNLLDEVGFRIVSVPEYCPSTRDCAAFAGTTHGRARDSSGRTDSFFLGTLSATSGSWRT